MFFIAATLSIKKERIGSMRKRLSIIPILALSILFSGCSSSDQDLYMSMEKEADEIVENTNFDVLEDASQKQIKKQINKIYDTKYSEQVKENIDYLKLQDTYDETNPLIIHNPYGTNTCSLYVYYKTDTAYQTSYTIHADGVSDFTQTLESSLKKTHEFQIIGLIPNVKNTITLNMVDKKGNTDSYSFTYNFGELLGEEKVKLSQTEQSQQSTTDATQLADGLYVVLGNDSDGLDFMYYYDNGGVLRGEVPIRGYRSHRLLFKDDLMYYSISEYKIATVDSLGQVKKIIDTGEYQLHHDYAFDNDNNLLVLASKEIKGDYENSRSEDLLLKINLDTKEITDVLDLEDVFKDYKKTTSIPEDTKNSEGVYGLDWMHINTIQCLDDDSIILSSRETSTIIKLSDVFKKTKIDYLIGEENFWQDTKYANKVLKKDGNFATATGQHSVTYETDNSLPKGQYYLYMFNNNFSASQTNPTYDWSQIVGSYHKNNFAMTKDEVTNSHSYYYKYLVDEKAGTYKLVQSFEVPYSSHVSSVQDIDSNIVVDSGFQGIFGEYGKDGNLLRQFKMKRNKYMIYRVYKYTFNDFYFNKK